MMYNAGLVSVVKCNGRILREDKEIVSLPFGSEYSILLKNLNSKRCVVNISIDGQDILNGNSLVLGNTKSDCETEIKGFMDGNKVKNKFKFIEKTQQISDFRGDRIDDGIVRIEYWFEREIPDPIIFRRTYFPTYYQYPIEDIFNSAHYIYNYNSSVSSNNLSSSKSFCNQNISTNYSDNQEGITVKGSETNQDFYNVSVGPLENYSKVIILKLKGTNYSGKEIEKPITVQTKKICSTCGKKSKSYMKFCSNCGTFLD